MIWENSKGIKDLELIFKFSTINVFIKCRTLLLFYPKIIELIPKLVFIQSCQNIQFGFLHCMIIRVVIIFFSQKNYLTDQLLFVPHYIYLLVVTKADNF